jgi:putative membrane protein insertion efficiency factor
MSRQKQQRGIAQAGVTATAMLVLIRGYQLTLSSVMGRHCRHLPTCSQYAYEAIAHHGGWAGFWLSWFRVLRCHPWGRAGFDPVPERIARFSMNLGTYRRAGAAEVSDYPNDTRDRHG